MPPTLKTDSEAARLIRNQNRLAPLTRDEVWKLHELEREAIARFVGDLDELESALGMLHLGQHLGWKPLVLIHNKRTIKKYEEILGKPIRDLFPEEGPSAERSLGYDIVKKIGNFWKAVSGEVKDDKLKAQRRELA